MVESDSVARILLFIQIQWLKLSDLKPWETLKQACLQISVLDKKPNLKLSFFLILYVELLL